MRFKLLHLQIPLANIVRTLRAHLRDGAFHALHLFLQSSDGRFRVGDVCFERALLGLCQGQRAGQFGCFGLEFPLRKLVALALRHP